MPEFKHLKIDKSVEFNEDQEKFLQTLDGAFGNILDQNVKNKEEHEEKFQALQTQLQKMKEDQNYESLQKQLNHIFENLDKVNKPIMDKDAVSKKERELNAKWVRAMLRKDENRMNEIMTELKDFDPFSHTGTDTTQANYLEQGSYTIPELFQNEVFRYVEQYGVARRDMRYLPMSGAGNERRLMKKSSAVVISWVDEAGRKPITQGRIAKVTQSLKKLAAVAVFTDEVLEDSAVDLINYTAQLFAEEISKEEDRVFLAGSTLASDPFDGILNASDVTTYALPATKKVADITADDLNKAIYELRSEQRSGASWYMSSALFGAIQRLKDENNNYIIQQPTGGAPATIWGYPVVISDILPGLTNDGADWDAETPFMFFANLSQTSVYGDKGGIAIKMLMEATLTDADGDTINLAQNDMTAMRVVKRVGYVNVLPEGILVMTTGSAT